MTTLEQLGSEKYVLLTTYRRDGQAVSTPLWVVPNGGGLAFWTPQGTGKVKRIRNSGRVTVTACDRRGNPHGDAIEATATLGDSADHARLVKVLTGKYGLISHLIVLGSKIRRGTDGTVVILVS